MTPTAAPADTDLDPDARHAAAAAVERLERNPDAYGHILDAIDAARGDLTRGDAVAARHTGPGDWVTAA